jgi:hypothetical protein
MLRWGTSTSLAMARSTCQFLRNLDFDGHSVFSVLAGLGQRTTSLGTREILTRIIVSIRSPVASNMTPPQRNTGRIVKICYRPTVTQCSKPSHIRTLTLTSLTYSTINVQFDEYPAVIKAIRRQLEYRLALLDGRSGDDWYYDFQLAVEDYEAERRRIFAK